MRIGMRFKKGRTLVGATKCSDVEVIDLDTGEHLPNVAGATITVRPGEINILRLDFFIDGDRVQADLRDTEKTDA